MTFPVRTICGSMRYYSRMLEIAQEESRMGTIIIMPFVAFTPDEQPTDPVKKMLDQMHFAKIDMSSGIIVVGEHRGESTTREIEYAKSLNLEIIEVI